MPALIGKSKPMASVSARVFSGPNGTGELLADLGSIAGGPVKVKADESKADLEALKDALVKARKDLFRATRLNDKELMAEIKGIIDELEPGMQQAKEVYARASKALDKQDRELQKKLKSLKDRGSTNKQEVNHGSRRS